ISEALKSIIVG
uniref:Annulatin n=1 Tax=Campsomeriella annulata TaxID=1574124 RepID=ANNU_CAMAN|nr:RecName: Full=Annulatin; AltName: Full=Linear alpha-helical peptide [Campsomeriella annulata]